MEDMERVWKHIGALEAQTAQHDSVLRGMQYTIFGVPELPGTGLAQEFPRRIERIEAKLTWTNRLLAGALLTVIGDLITRLAGG